MLARHIDLSADEVRPVGQICVKSIPAAAHASMQNRPATGRHAHRSDQADMLERLYAHLHMQYDFSLCLPVHLGDNMLSLYRFRTRATLSR